MTSDPKCPDSTIGPGDLVMVVKPTSCCGNGKIGFMFVVHSIGLSKPRKRCPFCGIVQRGREVIVRWPDRRITLLWRLKKITPPAVADHIERREEVDA